MAEVARSVSEWCRRMTAEKLNQSGQPVDMTKYPVCTYKSIISSTSPHPSKRQTTKDGERSTLIIS
jgi:hypothetical protein